MASVFLLTGWYILRFDPDAPDRVEPTAFASFLIAHRRQLQMFGAIGFLVSTGRFGASCFGADWPGRWIEWPLALGLLVLFYASQKLAGINAQRDWTAVPRRPRLIKNAEGVIVFVYPLLFAGIQLFPRLSNRNGLQRFSDSEATRDMTRIVFAGAMAILYGLEALFLSHRDFGPKAGGIPATEEHG
jgi:hypothetical protein